MCVMQTGILFLSLSGGGGGNSSIYVKGLPAVLDGMGRLVCLTGYLPINAISAPKLADIFWFIFIMYW